MSKQLTGSIRCLHALKCRGVIRAARDHGGFRTLFDEGYADCRETEDGRLDYFLTDAGKDYASVISTGV